MTHPQPKTSKIVKHIYRSVIMEYEITHHKLPEGYPLQKTFHALCSECDPKAGYKECGACDGACLCLCHENTYEDPRLVFIPMVAQRLAQNTPLTILGGPPRS